MEGSLNRVLLLHRGALARRNVAAWRAIGAESVLAFGTEDAEAGWVDEADYAVYHGGAVGQVEPERLVGAAMDAGCDALDAGWMSDDVDVLDFAVRSNLAVVGCDPHRAAKYRDPDEILALAGRHGVPAAPVGPWPEAESLRRRVDVWVVIDRQQGQVVIPPVEATVGPDADHPWLLEHGDVPGPAASRAIRDASSAIAHEVGGPGLLRVRWGWLDETTWALRGLTSAVGPGWPLIEAVHGFDPVKVRLMSWRSGGGNLDALETGRHAVLARIVASEEGELGSLALPDGGIAELEAGDPVRAGDPLAQVVATAPTRQAALVRLASVLDEARVEGVSTNLDAVRALAGDRELWEGRLDARRAAERLGG